MCSRDFNCPNNQICVANASWFVPGSDPCICSSYYGFSGAPDCLGTLETPTSVFWVVSGALLVTITSILFIISVIELFRLHKYRLYAKDAQTIGTAQIFLGSIIGTAFQAGCIRAALSPTVASGFVGGDTLGDKGSDLHLLFQGFFAVYAVLIITGAITIALMWIEVAIRCDRMQVSTKMRKNACFRSNWIAAGEFVAMFAIVLPIALAQQFVSLFLAYVLEVFAFCLYIYGNWKIRSVIMRLQKSDHTKSSGGEYAPVLRRMQISTIIICLACGLTSLFSTLVLIPTIVGWKNFAHPDTVSIQVWALQVLFACTTMVGFETMRFLSNATSTKIRRDVKVDSRVSSKKGGEPHGTAGEPHGTAVTAFSAPT